MNQQVVELSSIFVNRTENTPEIDFNNLTGELILEGRSIPANSNDVYGDAFKWVSRYSEEPRPTTNLRLNLEYFNTSSIIWIAKIIRVLTNMDFPGYTLIIHMYIGVEEIEDLDPKDVDDLLFPLLDFNTSPAVNLCVKLYGVDSDKRIVKESDIFL